VITLAQPAQPTAEPSRLRRAWRVGTSEPVGAGRTTERDPPR